MDPGRILTERSQSSEVSSAKVNRTTLQCEHFVSKYGSISSSVLSLVGQEEGPLKEKKNTATERIILEWK